jgi:hypothetical protein
MYLCANHCHNDVQKDKEDLEEISTELELADEDELVPYVFFHSFLSLLFNADPMTQVQNWRFFRSSSTRRSADDAFFIIGADRLRGGPARRDSGGAAR